MYHAFFWSSLTLNVVVLIYISLTPYMHVQPWRLLALGAVAWMLMFWFQNSIEITVKTGGETAADGLRSGVALMATTVSAMVGALFGTAISNRSKLLHESKVERLMGSMADAEKQYREPAEEIYAKLTNQEAPLQREEFMQLHSMRAKLIAAYHLEMSELKSELRKLNP